MFLSLIFVLSLHVLSYYVLYFVIPLFTFAATLKSMFLLLRTSFQGYNLPLQSLPIQYHSHPLSFNVVHYFHHYPKRCSFGWSGRFRTGVIWFGCISDPLFFGYMLQRVTLGPGRLVTVRLKINYSSYPVSIGLVSVEDCVECQSVSSYHRLIVGLVLRVQIAFSFFFSRRIRLRITNYYLSSQYQIKLLIIF